MWENDDSGKEWSVLHVKSHSRQRQNTLFEIEWKSGNVTWLPYHKVDHLTALTQYLKALGMKSIDELGSSNVISPQIDEQVMLGHMEIEVFNNQEDELRQYSREPNFSSFPTLGSPFFRFSFHHNMPEIDWRPSRALINNLKTNFPFIYAGEPALWTMML
jgi:hypothetical protein